MEVLWNQMDLQKPPYRSWEVSVNEFDPNNFIEIIGNILNDFKAFEVLHSEAALLSRLIYRMKSKFRSDKGLKHMEKVNRALLNYLNMSIKREYELLKEQTEINVEIISLPPRQTLEYVLVRTQGFAKLMCRIESTSMIAGNILKSRLHIGQSWALAMIAYAVISRIWILSRLIIKKSCSWYDSIYEYLKTFKKVGTPWLPNNYILPENLEQWLDIPWINEDVEKMPIVEDWEKSIFDFIKTNDAIGENLNFINDSIKESSETDIKKLQQNESILEQKDEDLGEPISRLDIEELRNNSCEKTVEKEKKKKKSKDKKSNKKLNILDVKTEKDIVKVLKAESIPELDKLQCSLLQKRIKKLVIKLTRNNTCELDEKSLKKINQYIKKWTTSR